MGIFFYRPSRGLQLVFSESFEYPNWEQTFDVNNLPSPAFSGSAIYTEDFDSSWDDT